MHSDNTGLVLGTWVTQGLKSGVDDLVPKQNKKTLEVS